MKYFKQRFFSISISALAIMTLLGCNSTETTQKEIEVARLHAAFDFDIDNIHAVVGDADNVFVGYVNKLESTEYKFPVTVETDNGTKEVSSPYTNYSITVINNMKGKLKKDEIIPMQKSGGQSKEDENVYVLYEDDFLPEEEKYYIFTSYNQPDGSILISGPHSNVEINAESKSEIVSATEYKDYEKAVQHEEKPTNRQRFESKYEE